ncbi:hypothetical protein Hanom_Chr03g00213951 [Helianthus anomalus]
MSYEYVIIPHRIIYEYVLRIILLQHFHHFLIYNMNTKMKHKQWCFKNNKCTLFKMIMRPY